MLRSRTADAASAPDRTGSDQKTKMAVFTHLPAIVPEASRAQLLRCIQFVWSERDSIKLTADDYAHLKQLGESRMSLVRPCFDHARALPSAPTACLRSVHRRLHQVHQLRRRPQRGQASPKGPPPRC
jgi:hypothetical protein